MEKESKIIKKAKKKQLKINKEKQKSLDEKYMRMAQIWSENSHAKRLKVGALIVKDGAIISDGYNGTPKGFDNKCEYRELVIKKVSENSYITEDVEKTKPYVLHAEANAITKLARSTNSSEGSTLYTLVSPCLECAKLIIQSGIIRVVYNEDYRNLSGVKLLKKAGIKINKITI